MNHLQSIPQGKYLKDRELIQKYNQWSIVPIQGKIAGIFSKQHTAYNYKKISDIQFKDFDFNKKVTFNELLDDLMVKQFVNAILDASAITMPERKWCFKVYYKRLEELIGKKYVIYVRHYLRKLYGFGIYQLPQIRISRLCNNNKAYTTVPLLLVPTDARAIKQIKQYYGKEIKPILIQRNDLFLMGCNKRKRDVDNEIENQEEIKKELENWGKEE